MTPQIALTLTIIGVAVVLFATEKLRVDVVALIVLLTLALMGLVSPEEAFAGFANPAVITVWAVFIVSGGLFKTGVADFLGQQIARLAGSREARLHGRVMQPLPGAFVPLAMDGAGFLRARRAASQPPVVRHPVR